MHFYFELHIDDMNKSVISLLMKHLKHSVSNSSYVGLLFTGCAVVHQFPELKRIGQGGSMTQTLRFISQLGYRKK